MHWFDNNRVAGRCGDGAGSDHGAKNSQNSAHMGTNGNGLGRFIPQLKEITLTFCRKGGSSQGVRCGERFVQSFVSISSAQSSHKFKADPSRRAITPMNLICVTGTLWCRIW